MNTKVMCRNSCKLLLANKFKKKKKKKRTTQYNDSIYL